MYVYIYIYIYTYTYRPERQENRIIQLDNHPTRVMKHSCYHINMDNEDMSSQINTCHHISSYISSHINIYHHISCTSIYHRLSYIMISFGYIWIFHSPICLYKSGCIILQCYLTLYHYFHHFQNCPFG